MRGEITFKAGSTPDYVVVRANGQPLYPLTNPVDDALMGITHILRGEDILSSTPRQIVLFEALKKIGIAKFTPEYAHLPYVMGEGNKKLSKRDPESSLFLYRDEGFVPEGMINYLSLLGWGYSGDQDIFTREQFVAKFDVADVNPNPARVDYKKALAINADHMRMLDEAEFTERMIPYLEKAGVVETPITEDQRALLAKATPLVQPRMNLLGEAPGMLRFLFIDDADLVIEEDALKKLGDDPVSVVRRAIEVIEEGGKENFTTATLEAYLREAIIDGMGVKPRLAFGPLRSGISGRRVSPPLFESMELLGYESTIARLSSFADLLASR